MVERMDGKKIIYAITERGRRLLENRKSGIYRNVPQEVLDVLDGLLDDLAESKEMKFERESAYKAWKMISC